MRYVEALIASLLEGDLTALEAGDLLNAFNANAALFDDPDTSALSDDGEADAA